jgi:hypothetical protein
MLQRASDLETDSLDKRPKLRPERRRPLGRPRRKWEDNIKMDLRERGWGGVDWRALVNMVMNLRVP